MTETGSEETTPFERVLQLHLAGNRDEALRLSIAALTSEPEALHTALLLVEILVAAERTKVSGDAAERLVDRFVRRGDLTGAVSAAEAAQRAGKKAAALHRKIARVFSKESRRVADVSPAPPPLPKDVTIAPELEAMVGDALLGEAERVLGEMVRAKDSYADDRPVPHLPLFSAMKVRPLERLLACFEVRDVAAGEVIIRQGDEGNEAFVVVRGLLEAIRESPSADAGSEKDRPEKGGPEPAGLEPEPSDPEGVDEVRLAAFGPGAIFGEMALVSEAPRAASVRAIAPSRLLVAGREVLEKLAESEPVIGRELGEFCRTRMVANLMRHSAILGAVAPDQRPGLMALFATRTFAEGEMIVRQGEESDGLYLIASGDVQVVSSDSEGDRIVIATLGPGDVVGEISLVLRRPANANVSATTATVALCLSRASFHDAIKEHPTLLTELYELAVKREDETRSVVAQEAVDLEDVVLL
jgi:CRP-like cAMP-binding protein